MAADLSWCVDPAGPVAVPGQLNGCFDAGLMAVGHTIRVEDRYRLYYWGRGADGVNRICIAEAPVASPNDWQGLGAVLGPQPGTRHNCGGPVIPCVLPRDDGPWLMYLGTNGRREENRPFWWWTAIAESHDAGRSWAYVSDQPVFQGDNAWDRVGTGTVFVLREQNLFRMYYTCCSEIVRTSRGAMVPITGIGYAESLDGIDWRTPLNDFLIAPRRDAVDPCEDWIAKPMVLTRAETGGHGPAYRMWVSVKAPAYRVRSLTSEDGLHWDWVDAPQADGDLGVGPPGAFDDKQRSYAAVVHEDGEYRMWYTGNGFGATGMGYATAPRPR
jgi:hypothetical protein